MFDYEKIADKVMMPEVPAEPSPVSPLRADREYLPVTHEKYQGLAEAKGYNQDCKNRRIQKTRYSHDAMIDVIMADPTITQKDLAEKFGYSQFWINCVIGSDAFQAALAKRRDELLDPFLVATMEERFRGLAMQSLEVIAKKLESSENVEVAFQALEISSKALGFGARVSGAQANVQNNFVVQLPPKIASAQDWATTHSADL